MNQPIDLDAWRRDGEQLWTRIQQSKLVVLPWNNPWRKLAKLGAVPLMTSLVAALFLKHHYPAYLFASISIPFLVLALFYSMIGNRTGGLYSFFSEKGFGVGCGTDRISIPYSSIQWPQTINPSTVNDNYIVLPVKAETTGVMIEHEGETALPWDGKPYRRGVVTALIEDGEFRVKAFPNGMIVHLFCAINPLSVYLKSQNGAPKIPANDAAAGTNSVRS